jgi:hypothetical protein
MFGGFFWILFLTKKKDFECFSNATSNYFNSSSKFPSIPISSKWLEGDLQPTLQSLGQFLFTKIKFLKFSDYKHFLKLVRMLTKENILSISI